MTALKRFGWIAPVGILAGCGSMSELKPAPGEPLPVKPLMARTTPTPEQLLTVPVYARPDRVDELVKRSKPREADPFDLPPPSGGAGPAAPAGTDPEPAADETGPASPQ
jgi:hypothetical protein